MLEGRQPRHQPGRQRRHAGTVRIDRTEAQRDRNPYGEEKSRPAGDPSLVPGLRRGRLERQAAARHDAVDMRMMVEILTPSMKHGDHADLGAQMPRIGRRHPQGLGCGLDRIA